MATGQSDPLAAAVACGLLPQERIAQLRAALGPAASADGLLDQLVSHGQLSRWQAAQVRAGRSRQLVLGPLRLVEPLDAPSRLYHAFDTRGSGQRVVVRLLPDAAAANGGLDRLQREAGAILGLREPQALHALEIGRDGPRGYVVYAALEGATLESYLGRGVLPPPIVARIGRDVALALAQAGAAGLVHGSLTPGQVLFDSAGQARVAGLGLSACCGPTEGAADYRAPELADPSHRPTVQSDLFSLGAMLYRALTGVNPVADGAQRATPPQPLSALNPQVPPLVADLIQRQLLAPQPGQRPATAVEVAQRLAPWAADAPQTPALGSFQAAMALDAAARGTAAPPQPAEQASRGRRRSASELAPVAHQSELGNLSQRPTWLAPIALLLLLLAIVGVVGGMFGRKLLVRRNLPAPQPAAATPQPAGPIAATTSPPTSQATGIDAAAQSAPKLLLRRKLTGHSGGVEAVAFLPDGLTAASAGMDRRVLLWRLETGDNLAQLPGHGERINCLDVSTQGDLLASAGGNWGRDGEPDYTIRIWNLQTKLVQARITPDTGEIVRCVRFTPNARRVLSSHVGGKLYLSNVETGEIERVYVGHVENVGSISFAPGGRKFVSGGNDQTIRVWDIGNNRERKSFGRVGGMVSKVVFLPDGQRVLAGTDDGQLRLWNADSGALLKELPGHTKVVSALAVLPDGRRALSGSGDGSLRLWDLESGAELARIDAAHQGAVLGVAVSADGQHALSSGHDAQVVYWDLPAEAPAAAP